MIQVLIPNRRPGVAFALMGLLQQENKQFSVIFRDEGPDNSPVNSINSIMLDSLSRVGIKVMVQRDMESHGLFNARLNLLEAASAPTLVCLDSDVVLHPTAMEYLVTQCSKLLDKHAFLQGTKYEIYPDREYKNDINTLGSNLNAMSPQQVMDLAPVRTYFCDGAVAVYKKSVIDQIWEDLTVNRNWPLMPNIGGEDTFISTLMAKHTKQQGLALPKFFGYHMHPTAFRWDWETPTDMAIWYNMENRGVPREVLASIFPHLDKNLG